MPFHIVYAMYMYINLHDYLPTHRTQRYSPTHYNSTQINTQPSQVFTKLDHPPHPTHPHRTRTPYLSYTLVIAQHTTHLAGLHYRHTLHKSQPNQLDPRLLTPPLHARSALVRASARGAGGRGSIPDGVTPKT